MDKQVVSPAPITERFLTLMGDLDDDTQKRLSQWGQALKNAGFLGTQTPGLPYHISLATYDLAQEKAAIARTRKVAANFSQVPVEISHIGIFAPGKVLFSAPERTTGLEALHRACMPDTALGSPWTPHITMLIDEPERICAALPIFLQCFQPMRACITKLHLCAFWPTREILSVALKEG